MAQKIEEDLVHKGEAIKLVKDEAKSLNQKILVLQKAKSTAGLDSKKQELADLSSEIQKQEDQCKGLERIKDLLKQGGDLGQIDFAGLLNPGSSSSSSLGSNGSSSNNNNDQASPSLCTICMDKPKDIVLRDCEFDQFDFPIS